MSLLDTLQKKKEEASEEVAQKEPVVEEVKDEKPASEKEGEVHIFSKTEEKKEEAPVDIAFDEDSIPKILNEIFSEAIKQHASDIHLKPTEDKFMVYFRIDGTMINFKRVKISYNS